MRFHQYICQCLLFADILLRIYLDRLAPRWCYSNIIAETAHSKMLCLGFEDRSGDTDNPMPKKSPNWSKLEVFPCVILVSTMRVAASRTYLVVANSVSPVLDTCEMFSTPMGTRSTGGGWHAVQNVLQVQRPSSRKIVGRGIDLADRLEPTVCSSPGILALVAHLSHWMACWRVNHLSRA